ncbi:putative Mitogen-activated protein kinase [Blattamonas nauphoetae]|uniref:Mitogen-activated protein kinase n=1 Tax=Blattamonas nauphoetae TaxID=2049346 RepID=A0ABQ9XQX5_9EUKA|nr:putative Mitogen-activated protein kinase [Blattamonas nauphoetae]
MSISFTVPVYYSVEKLIGKGTFGIVSAAINQKTQEKVAIKKISDAFGSPRNLKSYLRELRILTRIDHSNIIRIRDIFKPSNFDEWTDLYWASERMECDLHQILSSPQPILEDHIRYFFYQIVCGLRYLHSAGIIHRDIKPTNLLVNGSCELKICDLGLACGFSSADSLSHNTYVQTRWYRAPELLLGNQHYDFSIDTWSLGIVLLEMYVRKPCFTGRDYVDQLKLIFTLLQPPTLEETEWCERSKAREFLSTLPKHDVSFLSFFTDQNIEICPSALDLLSNLLQFNPSHRLTLDEVLSHPFLLPYRGYGDERLYTLPVPSSGLHRSDGTKYVANPQHLSPKVVIEPPAIFKHFPSPAYSPSAAISFEYETKTPPHILKHLMFQEVLIFHPKCVSILKYRPNESDLALCEFANPGITQFILSNYPPSLPSLPSLLTKPISLLVNPPVQNCSKKEPNSLAESENGLNDRVSLPILPQRTNSSSSIVSSSSKPNRNGTKVGLTQPTRTRSKPNLSSKQRSKRPCVSLIHHSDSLTFAGRIHISSSFPQLHSSQEINPSVACATKA